MSRYRFPASKPRKMYWSDEVGGCARCPDCKTCLEPEPHTYMMAVRKDGQIQPFAVGPDGGYFCAKCPVVVLNRDVFRQFATLSARTSKGVQFLVLGLVDLDAVPKEKRSLPFDDETNPVPVVEFTNLKRKQSSG